MVKENNEKLLEERKIEFLSKLNSKDQSVLKVKKTKEEEIQEKRIANMLRKEEKLENVQRIQR